MQQNQQLEGERDQLGSELSAKNKLLESKDRDISGLKGENNKLKGTVKDLTKRYEDLAKKRRPLIIAKNPLPPELNKALKKFATDHSDVAIFDEKNSMVKLRSDLTFPPGGATVNPDAAETLRQLVEILNKPEASQFAVYIAGHTDDMRIAREETRRRHPTNWYLSVHRAVGVQKILDKAGLDASRMCVMGFSEFHPVAPNQPNKKGNKTNRRVELWIVPPGTFLTTETAVEKEAKKVKKVEKPMGS
jgi:chemotaxis protein MotB